MASRASSSLSAFALVVACGGSAGSSADAMAPDVRAEDARAPDARKDAPPARDAAPFDAHRGGGQSDAAGRVDAEAGGKLDARADGDASLPPGFFGLTANTLGASHVPTVAFGGLRLWDTTAVWPNLNPSSGVFDFTELDAWLAEADAAGVDVLFTFGRTPTWASLRPTEACGYGLGCAAPPSDIASGDTILKSFVTALVNHSVMSTTAHIKYYEIWNEPDLMQTWTGMPSQLVTMAADITKLVHELDPSALVVGPSPSTGNSSGIHFLPMYYAAGGAPYEDIVAMHAYVYSGSVFATVPEGVVEIIQQLKLLMSMNGLSDKPIFFTEGAWGPAPNNTTMTDDEKVAYLARDYLLMWMNGISRFYWYAWDNLSWGTLDDGGIDPAGTAYGLLEGWLVGSRPLGGNCSQDASATWTCSLTLSSGAPALILWNPASSHSVMVPSMDGHFFTLDNATSQVISGGAVSVGAKPILVTD
jgi:hypothetical protein